MKTPRLFLTTLIILTIFIPVTHQVFAYEKETHKQLTVETIKLFNRYYPNIVINKTMSEEIINGSIEEDNFTRPLFHFYDPINNTGLITASRQWPSSKKWATSKTSQANFKSPLSLGSAFNSKIETDFSWQKAIEYYKNDDKAKAFRALGHIIHLIQDLSVPAHTRNDPHLVEDSYENFATEQSTNNLQFPRPVIKNNIENYFDELATYTNNNFYSENTVGIAKYSLPQPDYPTFIKGYSYGTKSDYQGQYFLSRKSGRNILTANSFNITTDDPLIMKSYWKRLAPKAVSYSAGVIHLFLQKTNALPITKKQTIKTQNLSSQQNQRAQNTEVNFNLLLGKINDLITNTQSTLEKVNNIVGRIKEKDKIIPLAGQKVKSKKKNEPILVLSAGAEESDEIDETGDEEIATSLPRVAPRNDGEEIEEDVDASLRGSEATAEATEEDADASLRGSEATAEADEAISEESEESDEMEATDESEKETNGDNIIISKFLFDTKGSDKGKEYVQLCNLGNNSIDISRWSIQTGDASSPDKKNFEKENVIAPKSSFLVSFGEDPNAGMTWKSGSLKNSSDTIYLVNNQEKISSIYDSTIIDTVTYNVDEMNNFQAGDAVAINPCWGVGGISSSAEKAETDSPSPSIVYYKNPDNNANSIIDINTDDYQPISQDFQFWKILVFYKNQEKINPPEFINSSGNWTTNQEGVLTFSYPNYASNPPRKSLIVPENKTRSGSGGGIMNSAYDFKQMSEDGIIRLNFEGEAKYLSVAVYDFYQSGGGEQTFKLSKIDKQKYYQQEQIPDYQSPIITEKLKLEPNKEMSHLNISWPMATDQDSQDKLITYNMEISGSINRTFKDLTFNNTNHQLVINPDYHLEITVIAKDEYGNQSKPLTAEWNYPESEILLSQTDTGKWSNYIGRKNCSSCEVSVSEQKITSNKHLDIDFVTLRIDAENNGDAADLQLKIKDEHSLIAVKTIPSITRISPDEDFTFAFDNTVTLEKDKEYTLTLDVSEYHNSRAYYRSQIRNALNNSNEWYIKIGRNY